MDFEENNGKEAFNEAFSDDHYMVRRKVFKIFGAGFHIYDSYGELTFYTELKAFKLKEDIRVFSDEDMDMELLSIQARQIIDFSAAYDVIDPATNIKIGALKRRGFKSIVRDEWIFMDANDNEIGTIKEDSTTLAVLRRLLVAIHPMLTFLTPQKYIGEIGGIPVCTFKQNRNPFVMKIMLDYSLDSESILDRRLGIAAAILLTAIEGRQDG